MAGGLSELAGSVHNVMSNEDLLMEILLRLPVLSLHLFNRVSKQWRSLITSRSFILTLRRTRIPTIGPPSGLFLGREYEGPRKYDFVSFDPRIPAKRSILFSFNLEADIRQSCNGLLLCKIGFNEYSIYNPFISKFKMLPPIHDLNYDKTGVRVNAMGVQYLNMAFDPTESQCYKVVHAGSVKDEFGYSIRIQTYSSEICVWSVWDDRFPCECFRNFYYGMYWNGAIHWLTYNDPWHVKLDIVDRPVLTNIQTPLPLTDKGGLHHQKLLFKSQGSLLLLCKDYVRSRHLNIYEMKNEHSEWSVRYFVNIDDMMRPFPTWRMPTNWDCGQIFSIVLGEGEEDSFMVFELSGKVLQYKFVSDTIRKLLDLGKEVVRQHDRKEFIASFVHV